MTRKSRFLAAPYLVWLAIFTIIPLALIVVFAFTTTVTVDETGRIITAEELLSAEADGVVLGELTEKTVFTLDNITATSAYMPVMVRSIWLALIATVLCLVIGYPTAYLISRLTFSRQKMMLMLVMLPMWMNFLLRTYAWMTLLERNGWINKLLGLIGLGPFEMINTQGAVVLGMVYNYLPFMILPLYSIMTKIDNSVLEAAGDLGCNPIKTFSRVVWPLSLPGVATGITMVFVPAISTFIISRMLGGGTNMLIGDLIDLQFLGNAYNPNLGAAISLVLMAVILLCMSITNALDNEDMEGGALL
ncbi:MAG: ABC transporter permease [Clostridiales bacterium]|nr:ABC transporter permease [Clostridiales bacterium]